MQTHSKISQWSEQSRNLSFMVVLRKIVGLLNSYQTFEGMHFGKC